MRYIRSVLAIIVACAGFAGSAAGGDAPEAGNTNVPKSMQAIVMHGTGGPEVLKLESVPVPEPAAGELRIRVIAAALNPVDWKRRKGVFRPAPGAPRPPPTATIPGFDAAGTVDAVGPGVTGFRAGDEVYAGLHRNPQGAYAQYVVVDAENVAPKPARLDFDQAASLVTSGVTALRVVNAAGITKGQTVLVQGGAGGVGTLLVQILRDLGVTVLATASARNADYLRDLGVELVIDYTSAPFEESVSDVDAVVDLVGGDVTARSVKVVKPGGVLLTIANRPPEEACAAATIRCPLFVASPAPVGPQLRELAALVADGKLRTHVDQVFPLAQAGAAQQLSETRHARGKIVLRIP